THRTAWASAASSALQPDGTAPRSGAGLLRGPGAEIGAECAGEAALERKLLTRRARALRLRVERLGRRGRTAPVGQLRDGDGPAFGAFADLQSVLRVHELRRLDALAVHVHTPAEHGGRREAAGLEEAGGPEPLVDSHTVHRWAAQASNLRPLGLKVLHFNPW